MGNVLWRLPVPPWGKAAKRYGNWQANIPEVFQHTKACDHREDGNISFVFTINIKMCTYRQRESWLSGKSWFISHSENIWSPTLSIDIREKGRKMEIRAGGRKIILLSLYPTEDTGNRCWDSVDGTNSVLDINLTLTGFQEISGLEVHCKRGERVLTRCQNLELPVDLPPSDVRMMKLPAIAAGEVHRSIAHNGQ